MSIKTFFRSLGHLFSGTNLTAAEKVVSDLLPVVGDDLAAFSETLPSARESVFALAEQAIKLVKDAKGQTLSFSMGLHLAQATITAHWPEIASEAETLITTGKL